ncbi:MAG: hypothetical protein KKE30_07055 [Gammaproteobacteria bacterium]|nr:hypothetical protein [Gammaproteobacteria bacterium]MBU1556232.1 hypothetical protein [Gammaproteobacteria bacterium]MBU2071552.1 hypothetical protein [Gammaproteobacteria bacterium]MBU2184042.1 hypothetical protein [Gammaproteobacteria bacterium]MBU2206872.1 hypothetical protein [Gammaproteobacteria bacterium]
MDHLKLCCESRPSSHKKLNTELCLVVYVNDVSIEQLLKIAAAKNHATTLGDQFLSLALVKELAVETWKKSCYQDSFITLLACSCGQWECSTLSVKTTRQANWVHWQFALNEVYQTTYGELPELWFDANEYAKAVQVIYELSEA